MKKKGFTLVELLAVIVVLAVIALIATPIILNIIDGVKRDAKKASARGYIDAVEKTVLKEKMKDNNIDYEGKYIINGSKLIKETEQASLLTGIVILDSTTLNVSVKGDVPKTGTLTISDKSNVTSAVLDYSDYSVTLNNKGEYDVQILTGGGSSSADVTALQTEVASLQEEINSLKTKVNNNSNYSTDEKLIGKWIDGKDLYRKTFKYSGAVAGGTNLLVGKINNMENGFIDVSASYFVNTNSNVAEVGSKIPVVATGRNAGDTQYDIYSVVEPDGDINCFFGNFFTASEVVVTVNYTKTS